MHDINRLLLANLLPFSLSQWYLFTLHGVRHVHIVLYVRYSLCEFVLLRIC